jgi:hypothetical protein
MALSNDQCLPLCRRGSPKTNNSKATAPENETSPIISVVRFIDATQCAPLLDEATDYIVVMRLARSLIFIHLPN